MLALPHGAADTAGTPDAPPAGASDVPRQERRQVRRDADRPHARPAAAVRNRERLVQVQVADVSADRRRAGEAHLRVHVRAVHVDLAAVGVDHRADVLDVLLVDTVRRGVGDHQACQAVAVFGGLGLEIGQVHFPVGRVGHDHHRHASHRGAGRVGAVRGCRDENDVALALAARAVVGADDQQAREFALRAGVGLQRHGGEAGDGAQRRLHVAQDLRVALDLVRRHERVDAAEPLPRHRHHLGGRVELHRARPERNHRRVEAEVLALEVADVPHHLRFRPVQVEHRVREERRRPGQSRRGSPVAGRRRSAPAAAHRSPPAAMSATSSAVTRSFRAMLTWRSSRYRRLMPASSARCRTADTPSGHSTHSVSK